jgi:HAD superfamily hydrolase (TIGR01509 family)
MTPPLRALVFDVDGTLADTEPFHLQAFNEAFATEGLDWHWDEALYTQLLDVSGGMERILHYWKSMRGHLLEIDAAAVCETVARIHLAKTAAYERMVNDGHVQLRPGVLALMEDAQRQGLQLAIATTTSPVNIAALLRRAIGPTWRLNFPVICDASSAPKKKPHPQVYLQVLQRLRTQAQQCMAFEDSSNGLRAACAARIPTVITPTRFTASHDFTGALRVLDSLASVRVADLFAWHEEWLKRTAAATP